MSRKQYDVLIIGGGINGSAIAHDAASRGLKVALVEKGDFSSGTTAASSKLAHGGLRYLKNYDFDLVRESLRERRFLQRIAPHLIKPIPFVMPLYRGGPNKAEIVKLGMILYDILSYDKSWMKYDEQKIPLHKILSIREALIEEPRIMRKNLRCAVKYWDCQISSPERLCLEYLLTAAGNGANVSNYTEVERVLIKDNKVKGVEVRDKTNGMEYKINADIVVNATGPWLDKIIEKYDGNHKPLLRVTKGIHIITPKISNSAVVLSSKKTGRAFFVENWHNHGLIGTTDADFRGDLDSVNATKQDIEGLVDELNEVYNGNISLNDIKYSYAGVRPLINEEEKNETEISRKYNIREESIEGLITVLGGKITTARNLAENAVNVIYKRLGKEIAPCKTKYIPLYGSTRGHKDFLSKELKSHRDKNLTKHLINTYGSKYEKVLNYINPDVEQRISHNQQDIKAQVFYSLEEEMALTLEDFMLRRTHMGVLGQSSNISAFIVADIMAHYLGWDNTKKFEEVDKFQKNVEVRKW
ncbi:MAG: glycerol-3-phosphate dehydrogenase/oxidase [Nanoarchaeota archaeon]|nr:glycerol-3-phosphate dehydrogenase/oxidase [Nanoarchaeota archaeon]